MSMSGSKIREQVAHFLVDIHNLVYIVRENDFYVYSIQSPVCLLNFKVFKCIFVEF